LTVVLVVVYLVLSLWGSSLQFGRTDVGDTLADVQYYLSCIFGLDVFVALVHSISTPAANFITSNGCMCEVLIAAITVLDNFNISIPAPAVFLAPALAHFARILPCCEKVRNSDDVIEDSRDVLVVKDSCVDRIKQSWETVMALVAIGYSCISFYRYWIAEDWNLDSFELSGAKNLVMVGIVSFLILSVLISAIESALSEVRRFCDDSRNIFLTMAALVSFSTQVGLWLPVAICRLAKPLMKLRVTPCCNSKTERVDQPASTRVPAWLQTVETGEVYRTDLAKEPLKARTP